MPDTRRPEAWILVWCPEYPEYPRNGMGLWEPSYLVDGTDDGSDNVGDGEWLRDYWHENFGPGSANAVYTDEPDTNLLGVGYRLFDEFGLLQSDWQIVVTYDGATDELLRHDVE